MQGSGITNSMEPSSSAKASNHSATQEITSILWNSKVHYHVDKSPLLTPILKQVNLTSPPHYFFKNPV
jgi:hypothetical protein